MKPHSREDVDPHILNEIPEADAADQATPAVPDDTLVEGIMTLVEAVMPEVLTAPDGADPADVWEQHLVVPGFHDEDYEREDHDDDHR